MVRAEPSDHSWDVRPLFTQQQMGTWWQHWEVKGGEERNWQPYLTMTAAQDKCPSNGHSPNVRNRTWYSPIPIYNSVCLGVSTSEKSGLLLPCHLYFSVCVCLYFSVTYPFAAGSVNSERASKNMPRGEFPTINFPV